MIDMTTVIAKMFMLFAIMITGFITSRLGVIDETAIISDNCCGVYHF